MSTLPSPATCATSANAFSSTEKVVVARRARIPPVYDARIDARGPSRIGAGAVDVGCVAQAARRHIEDNFSLERQLPKMREHYASLL